VLSIYQKHANNKQMLNTQEQDLPLHNGSNVNSKDDAVNGKMFQVKNGARSSRRKEPHRHAVTLW